MRHSTNASAPYHPLLTYSSRENKVRANSFYDSVLGTGYNFYSLKGFHYLQNENVPDPELDDGRKIHVSVHPDDIENAWNAVCKIILKNGIGCAKVANSAVLDSMSQPNDSQRGKAITIYNNSPHNDWQQITAEIEEHLAAQNIRPGYSPIGDKPIPGSQYIHHRVDWDLNNKYVSAIDAARINPEEPHNPFGQYTPFDNVNVNHVYENRPELKRMPKPQEMPAPVSAAEHSMLYCKENSTSINASQTAGSQNKTLDHDIDMDRTYLMSLPLEYGVKNNKAVLRLNLKEMDQKEINRIQMVLGNCGISSEIGLSGLNGDEPTLKLDDAQTALFEKEQEVFMLRLAQKETLQFGKTATQSNVVRVDMQALESNSPYGQDALRNSMQRLHVKTNFDKGNRVAASQPVPAEMGSSGLFPQHNGASLVYKVDDPTLSGAVLGSVQSAYHRENINNSTNKFKLNR